MTTHGDGPLTDTLTGLVAEMRADANEYGKAGQRDAEQAVDAWADKLEHELVAALAAGAGKVDLEAVGRIATAILDSNEFIAGDRFSALCSGIESAIVAAEARGVEKERARIVEILRDMLPSPSTPSVLIRGVLTRALQQITGGLHAE